MVNREDNKSVYKHRVTGKRVKIFYIGGKHDNRVAFYEDRKYDMWVNVTVSYMYEDEFEQCYITVEDNRNELIKEILG